MEREFSQKHSLFLEKHLTRTARVKTRKNHQDLVQRTQRIYSAANTVSTSSTIVIRNTELKYTTRQSHKTWTQQRYKKIRISRDNHKMCEVYAWTRIIYNTSLVNTHTVPNRCAEYNKVPYSQLITVPTIPHRAWNILRLIPQDTHDNQEDRTRDIQQTTNTWNNKKPTKVTETTGPPKRREGTKAINQNLPQ